MAIFPGAIPPAGTADPADTLADAGHTSLHNSDRDEIRAIATKIGTGASTPTANLSLLGTGAGTSEWGQVSLTAGVSGILPTTNGGTGVSSDDELRNLILGYVYPVGSVYTNYGDSTNPGTLLEFGTWVACGVGRVHVGIDAGQTEFDTAGETGGSKEVTLTGAQSGTTTHSHAITDPGHNHALEELAIQDTGSGVIVAFEGNSTNFATGSNTTGITINNSTEANASQAHTNLMPYEVVYKWRRTA